MQDEDPNRESGPESAGDGSEKHRKPNLFQVAFSVVAAVFGVQTHENRERDFKKGDPRDYIAVYVVLVIALVIGMIVVVNLVLEGAGA